MKKLQRLASFLLVCCMVMGLLPTAVATDTETDSGICGNNLNWMLSNGVLTISGTGGMTDYSYSGNLAPWYGKECSEVIVENGITRIGTYAFYACNATKITLPSGITAIPEGAFASSNFTHITIPEGVSSIGGRAFSGCSITSITLPSTLNSVTNQAFVITSLKDVYYAGSESDWENVYIGSQGGYNDSLTKATIHYNSTGPNTFEPEPDIPINSYTSSVYFLSGWEENTRTIQFGNSDVSLITYTVADNVDISGIDSLLNKYVLVTMEQGDSVLEHTITDIQPVESKIGTVSATGEHSLTIDGTTYPVRGDFILPSYDGEELLYHTHNGSIMEFDVLKEKTGTLEAWDSTTGKITIESKGYPSDRKAYPTNYMTDLSFLANIDQTLGKKVKYSVANGINYQPILRLSVSSEPDLSYDYNVPDREVTEEESGKAELWNLLADFNGAYQAFCEAYAQAVIEEAEAQGYDPTGRYIAQAEAMMEADANRDRSNKFLTFDEPFDDSLKVYAYRALCQMIDDVGELSGVDFGSVDFSNEFTLGSDIVNQVASQMKTRRDTIKMGDVEVQIQCGFWFKTENRLGLMTVKRVTGGPTYRAFLFPNESVAKEAAEQYVAALRTLGNKATKNAYTTVIKELTGLSLSSMNEKLMSDALKRLNNKFSKVVIKGFDVGEVLTVLENCYDQYNDCKKLANLKYSSTMTDSVKSSLEKIINFDILNPVDFETTAATKNAAKKLTEVESRLIDALEEYFYNGKISDETLGKIDKNPFSWLWSGKCPIEIDVYDNSNNQIGHAGDNIWFTDDILIERKGEEIRVYAKEPVPVRIIGTDYGMMSFTIEEYADGHPKGRVNYYNIPLQENQTYTVTLASSNLSSVADVIMMDEQGAVVPAFEYLSASTDAKVQIAAVVSSENAGMLIGNGNYVKGDLVTLTAYANDGYQFVGWFDGDDCISISNTYAFVAYEDVSLIGQYEVLASLITFDPNGGTVSIDTIAAEANGKLTTLPTPTRTGYTFDGWYTAASGGEKITTDYVFASDTTIYAHWVSEKLSQATPAAPILDSKTSSTVTLVAIAPNENGATVEYSKDGGTTWQSSPTFTGLSASKEYNFVVRYSETENYAASDVSTALKLQTSSNSSTTTPTTPNVPNYNPGSTYVSPTYSITALSVTGGKVNVSPASASPGSTVTITTTPDNGYELASLTVTANGGKNLILADMGNGKYTFTMPSGQVSINAVFQPIEISWSNPFTDVSRGAWYYDAVKFANQNGLMNGIGNGLFAPEANLSRVMLAEILYNKEGRPTMTAGSSFSDVVEGTWYANAVTWAAANGIVNGYGAGLFGPNNNITREQLAVMLWRYAGSPAVTDRELHFADAYKVSGWALDALLWATEKGIINGKGNGILDPTGFATRAETAQILKNYFEK